MKARVFPAMYLRFTPLILFVRRFERCLQFYQKAFGLTPRRIYRGRGHPCWAEFQVGDTVLALHGGYKGRRYPPASMYVHFSVKDIRRTVQRIKRYGGRVLHPPKKYDFRPAQLQLVYATGFTDPDGNQFELEQVVREFPA